MKLSNALRLQIENHLLEARQARDPSSNGLLDRTDCLELVSRLGAALQTLLNLAEEMQQECEARDVAGGRTGIVGRKPFTVVAQEIVPRLGISGLDVDPLRSTTGKWAFVEADGPRSAFTFHSDAEG